MKNLFLLKLLMLALILFSWNVSSFAQGSALSFDGIDDNVSTGDLDDEITKFTLELWVYWTGTDIQFICGKAFEQMELHTKADGVLRFIPTSGVWLDTPTGTLPENSWVHIAASYDPSGSGQAKIYVNGKDISFTNGGYNPLTTQCQQNSELFLIGNRQSASMYFQGKMDEVRVWKDVRTINEVRNNMYNELAVTEADLVAYYKLNENTGTATVNSASANYNGTLNGTTNGGPAWITSAAFYGPKKCLVLDGADDYVAVTGNTNLHPDNFTVEAWVNVTGGTGTFRSPLSSRGNNVIRGWNFYASDANKWDFYVGNGNWTVINGPDVQLDKWTHLAATYDGTKIEFYVNGLSYGSVTTTCTQSSSDPILMGSAYNTSVLSYFFPGKIDEVRIWNDVRTSAEIHENMCKSLDGTNQGLVAYYNFDQNNDTSVPDITNLYDGTWNGATGGTNTAPAWGVSSAFNYWLGTTDAWGTATNWNLGTIPSSNDNIGIHSGASNYPTTTTDLTVNNLSLGSSSSAFLTVGAGNSLTVSGNLMSISTAGLVLNSDANGTAQVLHASSGVKATVKRYMTGNKWHLVSSPVTDQTLESFLSANSNIPNQTISGIVRRGMMEYNESSNTWSSFYLNEGQTGNLTSGKGYMIRTTADGTVSFTGTLASGTVSPALTKAGTGWNCIGNPFSTAIGMTSGSNSTEKFLSVNTSKMDDSYVAYYFWDQTNSRYQAVNNISGTYDYAQLGQGFFVKAKTASTTIDFTTNMKSNSASVAFRVPEKTIGSWIKFSANTPKGTRELTLAFNSDMTLGLDPGYDAGLFRSATGFEIYTQLLEDNGEPFTIQSLPETELDNLVIPVGIEYNIKDSVEFSVQSMNLPENIKVILEDRVNQIFTDLLHQNYITIISDQDSSLGRFYIHTSDKVVTENAKAETGQFKISSLNDEIIIRGQVSDQAYVNIFQLNGSSCGRWKLNEGNTHIIEFEMASGVYIVELNDAGTSSKHKLVIK